MAEEGRATEGGAQLPEATLQAIVTQVTARLASQRPAGENSVTEGDPAAQAGGRFSQSIGWLAISSVPPPPSGCEISVGA